MLNRNEGSNKPKIDIKKLKKERLKQVSEQQSIKK